ncbi:LCP family protein [Kocuria massiliensis]|uniref:LCP family protein n=1 Tax=Kocuria massiliensis TaxID=1926282 RepID=UPI000A1C8D81|nr:LCP family protein [Kocuria massiliensis]
MTYTRRNHQLGPHTEAQMATSQPKRPWYKRKGPRIAAGATLCAVAVAATLGFIATNHLANNLHTTEVSGLASNSNHDGPLNILVIGSDGRDGSINAGEAEGRRSDSLMILHLNSAHTQATGIQIPRDTMVKPPKNSKEYASDPQQPVQINSFLDEGDSQLVSAVTDLTGIPLDHSVDVSFGGFMSVVDALDGITMCLPEALHDPDANLNLPAGCQTLHGKDALAMARTRHAIGDGSDLARIKHQQQVMAAILDKVKKDNVLSNPTKMFDLMNKASSSITVDSGLKDQKELAAVLKSFSQAGLDRMEFRQLPVEPYPLDPNRVQLSNDGEAFLKSFQHD